jgi:hypothetical protein
MVSVTSPTAVGDNDILQINDATRCDARRDSPNRHPRIIAHRSLSLLALGSKLILHPTAPTISPAREVGITTAPEQYGGPFFDGAADGSRPILAPPPDNQSIRPMRHGKRRRGTSVLVATIVSLLPLLLAFESASLSNDASPGSNISAIEPS